MCHRHHNHFCKNYKNSYQDIAKYDNLRDPKAISSHGTFYRDMDHLLNKPILVSHIPQEEHKPHLEGYSENHLHRDNPEQQSLKLKRKKALPIDSEIYSLQLQTNIQKQSPSIQHRNTVLYSFKTIEEIKHSHKA
jgi:hypothetical protein